MVYCKNCAKSVKGVRQDDGYLFCYDCGRILESCEFSQEPTFVKNAAGQSQFSGNFVKTVQSDYSISRERILERAYEEMKSMSHALEMHDESVRKQALAFYRIALERNFTRGRKSEQVQAACLYIAFRENGKPYLLIDFSNYLRTNVYVLGAVFLQLCKVLRLEEHPIVQKPVDPSLFISKYTYLLLSKRNADVSDTALSIIASMKRDWMQTGRKPSGLCGAALYISALSHGIKCSKSDVLRIVHICEATLTKRLVEFENTESGSLTIEELNMMAKELERTSTEPPNIGPRGSDSKGLLCVHKDSKIPLFAHGLCQECYNAFIKLSGGLEGGLNPPAFQRAERERVEKSLVGEKANESSTFEKELKGPHASSNEKLQVKEPVCIGDVEHLTTDDGGYDKLHRVDGTSDQACDESESLSDIDDVEVNGYLHNEEEKQYKKIIWEEMNREYIEEQAAKEAAAAAAKEAFEANFKNCPEDLQGAKELAAAAAAAVAKSRKERQQKRAAEAKNSTPASTAAEATRQMLTKKRLSSKINYDVLEKLFDESVPPVNPKKQRTESPSNNHDNMPHFGSKEYESEDFNKDVESDDLYYGNVDDAIDYDDDYDGY